MTFPPNTAVWVNFGTCWWPCLVVSPDSLAGTGVETTAGVTPVMCFGTRDVSMVGDLDLLEAYNPADHLKCGADAEGLADAVKEANQFLLGSIPGEIIEPAEETVELEIESAEGDESEEDAEADGNNEMTNNEKSRREEKKRRKEEKKRRKKEKKERERKKQRAEIPTAAKSEKKHRHVESAADAVEAASEDNAVPLESLKRLATDGELLQHAAQLRDGLASFVAEEVLLRTLSVLADVRVSLSQLLSTQIGVAVAAVWKNKRNFVRAAELAGAITRFWYSLIPVEKRRAAAAASAAGSLGRRASGTPPPGPIPRDPLTADIRTFLLKNALDSDVLRIDSVAQNVSLAIRSFESQSQQGDYAAAVLEHLMLPSHADSCRQLLDGSLDPKAFVENIFLAGMPNLSQAESSLPVGAYSDMYVCPDCGCNLSIVSTQHYRAHGEDDHYVERATCKDCSHTWEVG
jgi:hypothetical protein